MQAALTAPGLKSFGVAPERAARPRRLGSAAGRSYRQRAAPSCGRSQELQGIARCEREGKSDADRDDPQESAIFKPLLFPALRRHKYKNKAPKPLQLIAYLMAY